jgi:hypothetical protein
MKRRVAVIIISIQLILILPSCKSKIENEENRIGQQSVSSANVDIEQSKDTLSENSGTEQENNTNDNKYDEMQKRLTAAMYSVAVIEDYNHSFNTNYTIDKHRLALGGILIEYPQLSPYSFNYPYSRDSEDRNYLQENINRLIWETIMGRVLPGNASYLLENAMLDGFNLDVEYDVSYADDDVMSITFDQYFFHPNTPHYHRMLNTLNIDMNTGKALKLQDFITIDNNLLDLMRTYEVINPDGRLHGYIAEAQQEIFYYYSDDEILNLLNEDAQNNETGFYLTGKNLVIVYPVSFPNRQYFLFEFTREQFDL